MQRLLEGRINQLKQTVTITKCAHRTFAAAQWQELKQQLAAWKVCQHNVAHHIFCLREHCWIRQTVSDLLFACCC